jgi:hypothetical protein
VAVAVVPEIGDVVVVPAPGAEDRRALEKPVLVVKIGTVALAVAVVEYGRLRGEAEALGIVRLAELRG